jgi:hypothetical protein
VPSHIARERPHVVSRRRAPAVLAVAALAAALAACGSSSTPTTTTTTLPSVSASTAAIKHAYSVLFDLSDTSVAPKLAVVQDGSSIRSAMTSTLKTGLAKEAGGASTTATSIETGAPCRTEGLSSPCAKVVFNIDAPNGHPLLSHDIGFAVYQKGKWLVAKNTICTLLELAGGGSALSGC